MLLFENIVRLVVMGSQKKMYQIGFTPDFITASGISRMAVEFQVDLHSQCEAGSLLRAQSSLASVSKKTFNISHRLHTRAGKLIATGEQCLIAVDLAARRAVDVPEFIRRAI
jgi:acyl-CoA thioesterase FadM